jgi:hypothetical protein
MADVTTKEEEGAPPQVLPAAASQPTPKKETDTEPALAKEMEKPVKEVSETKETQEKPTESAAESTSHVETKADPLIAQATSQPEKKEIEAPKEVPEEAPDPDEDDLSDLDGTYVHTVHWLTQLTINRRP